MFLRRALAVKSRVLTFLAISVALACAWIWRGSLAAFFALIGDREAIVAYLEQYHAWGPVALFLILCAQVFLALIPGHAFMVAGGYIYGFLGGALITQASTVIASQLAFTLARKAGHPFVNRMAPPDVIAKWNRLAEKQGTLFFFFSFILPIFPNDLMCFVAGLSSIEPRKFFVANFLGRLPCAVFITLIGSHGLEMPLGFWLMIVIIIIGLCVFWQRISQQLERRFLPGSMSACA